VVRLINRRDEADDPHEAPRSRRRRIGNVEEAEHVARMDFEFGPVEILARLAHPFDAEAVLGLVELHQVLLGPDRPA
jgi:hypothetical protein